LYFGWILEDCWRRKKRKIMRTILTFMSGAVFGAYIAQNYKIPPIDQLLNDCLDKLKTKFPPKE